MARLRTVASYDLAAQAHLAKNILDEAGIPAVVHDEGIVAMDWLLANAVGGIKVQVKEEDAEQAEAILGERFEVEVRNLSVSLDEEELARQALAAAPDEAEPTDETPPSTDAEPPAGPAPTTERDEYARRLLYTALFSLVLPPLLFYALYLGLNAAFGPGPLSARGWVRTAIGCGVTAVWLLLWFVLWAYYSDPGFFAPSVY